MNITCPFFLVKSGPKTLPLIFFKRIFLSDNGLLFLSVRVAIILFPFFHY